MNTLINFIHYCKNIAFAKKLTKEKKNWRAAIFFSQVKMHKKRKKTGERFIKWKFSPDCLSLLSLSSLFLSSSCLSRLVLWLPSPPSSLSSLLSASESLLSSSTLSWSLSLSLLLSRSRPKSAPESLSKPGMRDSESRKNKMQKDKTKAAIYIRLWSEIFFLITYLCCRKNK